VDREVPTTTTFLQPWLRFWANEERRGVQSRDSILVVSRGSSFLLVQYLHILTTATRLLVHELVWCRKFVLAVGLVIWLDHFYSCFVVILYRDMGCNM